jgi:hypothetical protein
VRLVLVYSDQTTACYIRTVLQHDGDARHATASCRQISLREVSMMCVILVKTKQTFFSGSVLSKTKVHGAGEKNWRKKILEMRGIDPRTSRMLSERSTI